MGVRGRVGACGVPCEVSCRVCYRGSSHTIAHHAHTPACAQGRWRESCRPTECCIGGERGCTVRGEEKQLILRLLIHAGTHTAIHQQGAVQLTHTRALNPRNRIHLPARLETNTNLRERERQRVKGRGRGRGKRERSAYLHLQRITHVTCHEQIIARGNEAGGAHVQAVNRDELCGDTRFHIFIAHAHEHAPREGALVVVSQAALCNWPASLIPYNTLRCQQKQYACQSDAERTSMSNARLRLGVGCMCA